MQIAVKWIYQSVKDRAGIPVEAGQKPTLCFRGHKHMLCVAAGHPVRVLKRKASDFDTYRDVMKANKQPISVAEAVEQLEGLIEGGKYGTKIAHGVTIGARKLLDRAKAAITGEGTADEINEDEFNNEEEMEMRNESPAPVADGTSPESVTGDAAVAPKVKKKGKGKENVMAAKAKKSSAKKSNGAAKVKTTPFREGSKKLGAFLEFKSFAKDYAKLERGGKGEWAEKQAKKHGVEVTTMKSWIGGDFASALGS